jgi:hypothetical protein
VGWPSPICATAANWRSAPANVATAAEYIGQRLIITDTSGTVVADTTGERLGQQFNGEGGWQATRIDDTALREITGRGGSAAARGDRAGRRRSSRLEHDLRHPLVESANAPPPPRAIATSWVACNG